MNFIQKCKNNAGFTLVELIVVIAILAILAGVAVPAYTGYIAKAEEAADQQLLGAVNTAFAAACLEQGEDVSDVETATIELAGAVGSKSVKTISNVVKSDNTKLNSAEIFKAFQRYYAGNESSTFTSITQLVFVDGVFMDPADAPDDYTPVSYAGTTLYISKKAAAALNGSSFMTATGLGTEVLLSKVDSLTGLAGTVISGVFETDGFKESAAEILGIDAADLSTAVQEMAATMEGGLSQENINKIQGNAAVLYAAQGAAGKTTDDILTFLQSDDPFGSVTSDSDKGAAITNAALAYGMYTAYAYSQNDQAAINNAENVDVTKVMGDLKNNTGFQAYLKTEQAKADAEGYLSALNMINSSTGDAEAVKNLLTNGYTDSKLLDAINGALGK